MLTEIYSKALYNKYTTGWLHSKKFLGLHLTEDLKWDVHIKHVCNILKKNYYVIHSLKNVTSINTLRNTYFANFHSHLRYGILFWGSDSQSTKVFKLQKKVVRLICNVKRKTSCRELLKTLNILPVPWVYTVETVYYIKVNHKGLKKIWPYMIMRYDIDQIFKCSFVELIFLKRM